MASSPAPSLLRAFALTSVLLLSAVALTSCAKRQSPVEHGNAHQILHRGIGPDLADLDPHLGSGTDDYTVLSALFEGLVSEDPITLAPVPGTAARWEISPDALTYTFHLRPEAKWSNGDPVTAHHFARSYQRILTPALGSPNAHALYPLRGARAYHLGNTSDFATVGIRATDAHTLVLTLEKPTASFLTQLNQTAYFPIHPPTLEKFDALARRSQPWTRPDTIVTNGPFRLTAWKNAQKISVAKNPLYWDAATVRLNEVHFHIYDSRDAEERAFRAGQLHLTEALSPARFAAYRRENSPYLRIDPYLGTEFYRLRVTDPALQDVRVRRALSLAIDRNALCEKVLQGGQQPATSFVPPQLAFIGTAGLQPGTLATVHTYRPDEARRLLASAGYTNGKNAPPLELLYNTFETHRTVAEAIQQMWLKELGITVRLVNQENKIVQEARRTGSYQIARSSWIADYADPENFLANFQTNHPQNLTGWSNEAYDDALASVSRETNPAARLSFLRSAETLLLAEAPIIPLYHNTHIFLLQPSVKNWHPTLLDHHPLKHVYLSP